MTDDTIPFMDLVSELDELGDRVRVAIADVLADGRFILGPNVSALEDEIASRVGSRFGIGVNSGTDALVIGLRACGIGPGDEVVTSPFTFFATGESISSTGATPVFADIDPDTYCIDPDAAADVLTDRTRAIVPVHLYGCPADMGRLAPLAERHGLNVIEDVAQAFGARIDGDSVGGLGDVGAFSFFPSKNLGGIGDGGMIVTADEEVARISRMLRAHGGLSKYHNEMLGYNSRLDEVQACVLRLKLERIDETNARRRGVAATYSRLLEENPEVIPPTVPPGVEHVFHQYTVRLPSGHRDRVAEELGRRGIPTMVYYPVPLHQLPVYSDLGGSFPEAERAAREVLSLPFWPSMPRDVTERVASELLGAL